MTNKIHDVAKVKINLSTFNVAAGKDEAHFN